MKDSLGTYYYPDPTDHSSRMYVRRGANNAIEFRLWKKDVPDIWEKHHWIPRDVIAMANDLYHKERNANIDNLQIYDTQIAELLLSEKNDS